MFKDLRLISKSIKIDLTLNEAKSNKDINEFLGIINKISQINTDNVEPLFTTIEDQEVQGHFLNMKINSGSKEDIFKNTTINEDNYFLTPVIINKNDK